VLSALLNDQPFVWLVSAALVISLNLTFTRDTLKLPDCDDRGNSLSLITEGFFFANFYAHRFSCFSVASSSVWFRALHKHKHLYGYVKTMRNQVEQEVKVI